MKTKIFSAFLLIIFTALLSNFIFEWLIIRDFENYVSKVTEDQVYWIKTSAESSYDGHWNHAMLSETIHWAMMMGLDAKVLDSSGREIIASHHIIDSLHDIMKHRMEELFHIHRTNEPFREKPLYQDEKVIGVLAWRPFQKQELAEKEAVFKRRTKYFLVISFLIAGVGALVIAVYLSRYLSHPVTELRGVAEKIARGDFGARTMVRSKDEVGRLAEVFNTMAESLDREEKIRQKLMSNIAHELRTPLTIMKTQVEAMADGVVEDKAKGLDTVAGEIEKLTRLVEGIEDITSAEASFFRRTQETEINLKEFLHGIADELLPVFREKSLFLQIVDAEAVHVTTDPEKLERIVRNILSNALKFTGEGGVTIRYGVRGVKRYISIKDTGRGIPEKELPRIFTRFYKSEQPGTRGLGLGLAIAKELADIMEGEITVASRVNEGTEFTVFLPG